jgi:hypothetical protein
MDILARITPATRARRALLNDITRALLKLRRPVRTLVFDPAVLPRLKTIGSTLRARLHPVVDLRKES